MGTLGGHVVPGVFFVIWGGLWTWSSIWFYLSTKFNLRSKKIGVYGENNIDRKAYIPLSCIPRCPVDPIMKIGFGTICLCLELFFRDEKVGEVKPEVWKIYGDDHQLNAMIRLHHIAMEISFVLSGIVDCLSLCIRYPKRTPHIFLAIAFSVEFTAFYFHVTDDRSDFNVLAHVLLNCSIAICIFSAVLRIWQPGNILFNIGIAVGTIHQGIWFILIGVVLYGSHKWTGTMNERMFLSGFFLLQLLSIIIAMILLYTIVQFCVQYYVKKKQRSLRHETQVLLENEKSENDDSEL